VRSTQRERKLKTKYWSIMRFQKQDKKLEGFSAHDREGSLKKTQLTEGRKSSPKRLYGTVVWTAVKQSHGERKRSEDGFLSRDPAMWRRNLSAGEEQSCWHCPQRDCQDISGATFDPPITIERGYGIAPERRTAVVKKPTEAILLGLRQVKGVAVHRLVQTIVWVPGT
jgi:hypothetical protein